MSLLHLHACGIPAFRRGNERGGDGDTKTHMETARRVLQWRWLIVDEISMVSASLLAEMDMKLRTVIRDIVAQAQALS